MGNNKAYKSSFELRYYKDDSDANGETDFKGPTSVFDTEDRLDFLKNYANYAKSFFKDKKLDKEVVLEDEIKESMGRLKKQPLPKIRKKIPLNGWKWLGYKEDQENESREKINFWRDKKGIEVREEQLNFLVEDVNIEKNFADQTWRFSFMWKVKLSQKNTKSYFILGNEKNEAVEVGCEDGYIYYYSENEKNRVVQHEENEWFEFKVEVDLTNNRFNLYINGELKGDFIKLKTEVELINKFLIQGTKNEIIDYVWGVGYLPESGGYQYSINTFIDEDFTVKPSITGWQEDGYDDSNWKTTDLPRAHGSERYEGEDLYLRKKFYLGDLEEDEDSEYSAVPITDTLSQTEVEIKNDQEAEKEEASMTDKYERVVLDIESIDPGGEIWINGEIVRAVANRHPLKINISDYLNKNDYNVIAIKVKNFKNKKRINHAPTDINLGWFAGRVFLNISKNVYIEDVFSFTEEIGNPAVVRVRTEISNQTISGLFKGKLEIKFYKWYPEENDEARKTITKPFQIVSKEEKVIEEKIYIRDPELWTCENPNLYKVQVIIKDESDNKVDDYVLTTGIRKISQDGGDFRLNGKPEMLNGALMMGYRSPLDKIALWHRCAPEEWLVKEILMVRKMRGNAIRVHVHGWRERNINDPRLAEIGDQLGIMFIWGTTAWIRTGQPWKVDFKGYPKYIKQVRNHPSIVMWEASNHPNRNNYNNNLKMKESDLFFEKVYNMIYQVDQSRLISPTAHLSWFGYGNDKGSLDRDWNIIESTPAYTAPMVTRGNMEQITGYSFDWTRLREWPISSWRGGDNLFDRKDFLKSKERAYFNFETEESIGQPNWNLQKGKPSYHLHSYEWGYDKGTIGRKLEFDEWELSQAYQAFSAYESLKKQRLLGYDGILWCSLHGGANTATYQKPIIDFYGHIKLAFYSLQMVFSKIFAGSDNVDVVYGPEDSISPVIMSINQQDRVSLEILVKNINGDIIDSKIYEDIKLSSETSVIPLADYKPEFSGEGYYIIEYNVIEL